MAATRVISARVSSVTGPREWALLLTCARTRLGEPHRETMWRLLERAAELDWLDLAVTAARHGVAPLLYRHLAREAASVVPAEVLSSLEAAAQQASRRGLLMAAGLVGLVKRFTEAGVPVVPYKGPVLACMAYGNLALRSSVDLDFFVPQRYVRRAGDVLADDGYVSRVSLEQSRGVPPSALGEYSFHSPAGKPTVELHTERTLRYFPVPPDWEDLRGRLQLVAVGGQQVRTFSAEDTLVFLAVHGAKHFWRRLGWICDIAELARSGSGIGWESSERVAMRMGCRRMWLLGLSLAQECLGAPIPPRLQREARADRGVVALRQRYVAQLQARHQTLPGAPERLWLRLRSHESVRQGMRQCVRMAVRPTEDDWRAWGLPAWAAPLYGALRPWRLLRLHGLGVKPRIEPDLSRYAPSRPEVVRRMLHFAGVEAGDILYDLGCGDGAIVIAAARYFGIRAVGVDVDPRRIAEARARARQCGVEHLVEFRQQDVREADLSEASLITLYLELPGTLALAGKLRRELRPGARVVSQDYVIPGWEPDCVEQFDVATPHRQTKTLYLWRIVGAAPAATHASAGSAS